MKILDLIGIQKGLVKVTQSLKKMKETFKLMHSKFELNLAQSEFNQFTCWAFYEGRGIQGNSYFLLFPDHVDPTTFHGTLRIFVSG